MRAVRYLASMMLMVMSLAFAGQAQAQATRTWVSGVGDDANPCSRTAPCKTFAGAISKTAAGGEIDCLDPGGFGAVTITKAITLDCAGMGGQVGSIQASGTNGIIINITNNLTANDRVVIRNMTINGTKGLGVSGIRFLSGATLIIEHVVIFSFGAASGSGIDFAPTVSGTKLFLRDVEIQNNLGIGINIAPATNITTQATLNNVMVIGSGSNGLLATDGATVSVFNGTFTGNGSKGVFARSTANPVQVNLEDVLLANNTGQGVVSQGAASTVRLSNTGIYNNSTGILASGGAVISFGNNRVAGNNTDGAPTSTVGQL